MATATKLKQPSIKVSPPVQSFLKGAKKSLIGGHWTSAASGRTFEVFNPATGDS
jgi:phenylacetaldehyde dehydrogenase